MTSSTIIRGFIVFLVLVPCAVIAAVRFGGFSDTFWMPKPVDGAQLSPNTGGRMGLSATSQPKAGATTIIFAPAATFVVDRIDDTNAAAAQVCSGAANDCSLRGAITKHNNTGGSNTITFAASTNGTPFTLTLANAGGTNEDLNATGDLDVIAGGGLSIIGNGSNNTIIQGGTNASNGIDKVFAFNPFCNAIQANSVSDVTIRFGRNTQAFGAGDFSYTGGGLDVCSTGEVGSSFSISNSIVTQNTNTDGYGGGMNIDEVFPSAAVITITNTQFTNNISKYWGGGLNIFGDNENVTITGSTFTNNNTLGTGGVGAQGGGINVRITNQIDGGGATNPTPFVNISNTTIANNQAVGFGGGIDVQGSGDQNVTITNTSITGNSVIVNGGVTNTSGGGLDHSNNAARTTTLTNVLIANNSSTGSATTDNGGGVSHGSGTLIIRNSTISGNSTNGDGGGVMVTTGPTLTLINTTISNNRADADNAGGGTGGSVRVLAGGTVNLQNTISDGNKGTSAAVNEINGTVTANFSLIGNTTGATLAGGSANNQTNVSGRLAALANNGGQTVGPTGFTAVLQTHALNAGSPALDNGSNLLVPGALTTDQRGTGFTRILDAADVDTTDEVDIGSFEAHPSVEDLLDQTINQPNSLSTSFNVGDANFTAGIDTITVTSSNTTLVPNANINLSGTGTNSISNSGNSSHSLVITPAANLIGTTTITITATDLVNGTSQTMTDTFVLTVTAPDLTAAKTNNVSNAAVTGQTWTWTIAVTNGGNGAANFPTSSVILSDNLPNTGTIAYGSPTPSIAGVSCSINGTKDLTCTATSPVTLAASGGNFNIQFTAVAGTPGTAPGTYVNPRSGGAASVDPGNAVAESNEGNNSIAANSVVVSKASTSLSGISDSPDPSVTGQSYTAGFTLNVTAPGSGTPTGTVTVTDGTGGSCVATLPATSCPITSTTAGAKTLTFAYSGDSNFNTSNTTAGHLVNKADTTTTIASDNPDPSVVGQSVTVNFSVATNAPGSGTPTGNVVVTVSGGAETCTGTVASGTCTITLTSAGARTLTATYAGDTNYNGSSDTEAHQVDPANTTTTITSDNPDPSVTGQNVTVNFTVNANAPGSGTPTGNVVVTVSGGAETCTGTVTSGTCTITLTSAGARTLTATYAGDTNYNGSSDTEAHQVNKAGTSLSGISDAPDPSIVGQPYTVGFTLNVSAPGSGTPTGNVGVSDGAGGACTATLPALSCQLTSIVPGNKTLTLTYSGDSNFNSSVNTAGHGVNKANTTTTITSDNPDDSAPGASVTVNFSVIVNSPGAGTPTGNVVVTVSGGAETCTGTVAAGTCSIALNTTGTRTLTATYAGDTNFNGSSDTEAHTVIFPLGLAKSFLPTQIKVGEMSVMTFMLTNNSAGSASNVSFSDTFPIGIEVDNPVVSTNTCGGSFSPALAGAETSFNYTGGTLSGGGGTCSISVQVKAITAGVKNNTTGAVSSAEGGTGATSNAATLTVVGAPGFTKGFVTTASIAAPSTGASESGTTVTINTQAAHNFIIGQPVTISGVGVAGYNGTFTLTGTSTTSFAYTNASTGLAASGGGTAVSAATLSSIPFGASTTLNFTIANNNSTVALTGIGFTDVLPAGLGVADATVLNACGAGSTLTITAATRTITLTNGTLAAGTPNPTSCNLPVTVTGTAIGNMANTTGNITSTEGGQGATASATVNITTSATTTTITNAASLASTPTLVGQAYAVNVTVAPSLGGMGTPTGTVNVGDGTGGACTITLPATSCNLASTSPGAKTITATYNGDTNFGSSNGTASHTVNKANTTLTSLTDAPDPSVVGQPTTTGFTLNVTAPGAGTPTGTVSVADGAGGTCTATLPATSCQLTSIVQGNKTVTFTYNGDVNFNTSGNTAGHAVNKAGTTTIISADSPDPTVVGQNYAVTAGVEVNSPGGGMPTGTITVTDGTNNCTITLPATSCNLPSTSIGAKTLAATYNGDANFNASAPSTGVSHTVNKADTTTTITSDNPDSSAVGQSVTVNFTVAAAPPGTGTPTGTVTITASSGGETCTGTLAAGAGSCTLALTVPGSRTLTAAYDGDANFNTGTDTEPHIVVAPPSISKAFSPTSVSVGQTSTLTFTITNPAANTVALTGVGFADAFPSSNLVVATPLTTTNTCGGTLQDSGGGTLAAGDVGIQLTGGTVGVSPTNTCTVSVNVTPNAQGPFNNVSGNVTSTNGGIGNTASATLATNTPPTISSDTISLQAGSNATAFTIGTAADAEQAANTLGITINGSNLATSNGVTVSNLSIAANGAVTANVSAICGASSTTFNLVVTDGQAATGNGTLTVTVVPNTPPTLTYAAVQTIMVGTTPSFSPASGPSDNGTLGPVSLQSVTPNTGLAVSVSANGQVNVTGATQVGTYTVAVSVTDNCGSTTNASFIVNVNGGPATHFAIVAPPTATAGASFLFTIIALDAQNNVANTYGGTVHFTSTDNSPADLPANTMLTNGTATLSLIFFKSGIRTVSAYDTVNYSIDGTSNDVSVIGAVTHHFGVSAPNAVTKGSPFSFTVTALDAFENIAPTYAGTMHFTSTDGSGTMPADGTLTNGVGTFNATINTLGGQTITAKDISANTTGTSNNINVAGGNTGAIRSRADFDGDGRTDVSVFRPSEGNWYVDRSTDGFRSIHWGISTDMLIPGDYDGDGQADYAVFRPSQSEGINYFYMLNSTSFTMSINIFGQPGDVPEAGDYDGDGITDVAVYRASTGYWYIYRSQSQIVDSFQFGLPGDIPLVMDFNGDGKTDLAVYRPSDQRWYMNNASGTPAQNYTAVQFGLQTDILVPADYDGDNRDDVAVYRPSEGKWYIIRSSDGGITQTQFGMSTDIAVPGDYDGDGKNDIAVYRPSTGTWFLLQSTAGFAAQVFGTSTDTPIPAAYHP